MKRILSIFAVLGAAGLTTSCETQGDPTQGGLFGWSENKYQQREAAKVQHLHAIEADTAAQQRRANSLSGQVDTEREKLR
jgi:hypothetical protein